MKMDVLLFAPGAGLGHLNRALAIGIALRDRGVRAEIVTDSPFAKGLAELARFPITRIATTQWVEAAPALARERKPGCVAIDTFPAGLRGEWLAAPPAPAVYLARRLKREALPERISCTVAIVAEPLDPIHEGRIAACAEVIHLDGRIRLAPGSIPAPVPEPLERMLASGEARLVIHSGVESEVRRLFEVAGANTTAVITPWKIDFGVPSFDYYPAGNLIARAAHVFSGAGYNTMADMSAHPEKHTALAFDRRFDDQSARLAARPWGAHRDGTGAAADAIARVVSRR